MPTKISNIESLARLHLNEATPRFWSSAELTSIITSGIKDLWRDIADLKQEHFLSDAAVTLPANSDALIGVPIDVHKVYLITPASLSETSSNKGLIFKPLDFNHDTFQAARTRAAIDPANDIIYYAITAKGGPVEAPIIRTAPQVTSDVSITLTYVPTLGDFTTNSTVPIPGEADNALVAWCVAYARAKESEDRSPDSNWMSIYATEKSHLLQSLGLRQYQEPSYAEAVFAHHW